MLCNSTCPRGLNNCIPYSNSISDDGVTFICCGSSKPESRIVLGDHFRFCFKSETTDTIFDYDDYDIKEQIAVMADALAIHTRMEGGIK